MADPVSIWCGPDRPPRQSRGTKVYHLDSISANNNVHLKISNISKKLVQNLPSLLLDLLEIASYVYTGDQCVSRGGKTLPNDGADWRRDLTYNIAVRNLNVWESESVKEALISVLQFLSDDFHTFKFRRLLKESPSEPYFDLDGGDPWFNASEVMLFSGGLDSLAGLCETVKTRNAKVVLVSHRSAPQIDSVQKAVLHDFAELTKSQNRLLHIPVWVNKFEGLTNDTHQRTRSFLYASLAASIARMHGLSAINFYENGITSSNLPVAPSMLGARASRTTHPKVLKGFSKLFSELFGGPFKVENPHFWYTKADIVGKIVEYGAQRLIRHTTSCSHIRSGDSINTHCGVCSQCIGRRLAMLSNSMEAEDPLDMYKIKHPLEPMHKDQDRALVELIVKAGREFAHFTEYEFSEHYISQVSTVAASIGGNTGENVKKLYELHKRYGEQVMAVLEDVVGKYQAEIARGEVQPNSLLGIIAGTKSVSKRSRPLVQRIMVSGIEKWEDLTIEIVGLDAAKIYVNGEYQVYTAFQMGFGDRRTNRHNQLWELLVDFAEAKGQLIWSTRERTKDWDRTDFKRLRRLLQIFTGLPDDPFKPWTRSEGYVTRFKISYDRSIPIA